MGPLLFLIYVNDIKHAFTHASLKLFAEDINLFISHKDLITLYTLANTELEHGTNTLYTLHIIYR